MRLFAFVLALTAAASAQESPRDIAEWVLRMGGGVILSGSTDPVRDLSALPAGNFELATIDFTGTAVTPEDLPRIANLTSLQELYFPAYMWNEGAGSRRDSNELMKHLAGLKNLRLLQMSVHFLTNMNIRDNGMAQLAPLTQLEHLRLSQSRIKGATLGPFVNLRSLDVSYTPFDDTGMKSLAGMSRLEHLILRDTLVTDAGMSHLANLASLTSLDLYGCRITDAGVASLAKLTRLRKLNLLGAEVTDDGLDALSGMSELVELNLYRSKITNAGVAKLARFRNLASLDLRYSRATASGVDQLRKALPNLRVNFLDSAPSSRKVTPPAGTSPAQLARWIESLGGKATLASGRLVAADLGSTPITDALLSHLASAPIRKLDLQATEIGDLGLAAIGRIATLEELDLSYTTVTDRGLTALPPSLRVIAANHTSVRGSTLSRFPGLREVELAGNPVEDADLAHFAKFPALTRLRLSYTAITGATLGQLNANPALRVLDIGSNDINDAGLAQLAQLTSLTEVSLSYGRYTDAGLVHLKSLASLERLELNRAKISDAGLAHLAALTRLRSLNLNYTLATAAVLETLAKLPALEDLHLDTAVLADKDAPAIAALSGLKHLNLYHTLVTETGLAEIQSKLPKCTIVWDRESWLPTRRGS